VSSLQRRVSAKRIVDEAVKKGYTLTRRALNILDASKDPLSILDQAINKLRREKPGSLIIDEDDIRRIIGGFSSPPKKIIEIKEEVSEPEPSIEVDDRFLKEYAIKGSIEEFRRYFTSRYEKLRRMLEKRIRGAMELNSILRLREGQEAYAIAMALKRRETEKAILLKVDDLTTEATIIVPKNGGRLLNAAEYILPDSVFAIRLYKRGESLIAKEIILPDIPSEAPEKKLGHDAYICMISDIHVGSKKFRRDLFESFLDWINRARDSEVKRIKFLVIAGDLVDGVGVYPNQQNELEITSVNGQFEETSRLLAEIPKHIKVIIAPGNHEPIQKALPQPPLQGRYKKILERHGRGYIYVGNPAWIRIGGRALLIYHGQGLDDVIQIIPGLSHSNLGENIGRVLELLLKHRHLSPIYGESTPLMPLSEDLLVIDRVPDIFHVGHIHVAYAGAYRNVRLLNTGTWQEQTGYQRSMGLNPTVGVAALVSLKDLTMKIKKFL